MVVQMATLMVVLRVAKLAVNWATKLVEQMEPWMADLLVR